MLVRIRGAIVLIGMAAVFGLFLAKPFFPAELRELAGALATVVFVATFGLILLINKVVCGTFFLPRRKNMTRPLPRRPRSEGRDPVPGLFLIAGFGCFGVLTVYVLRQYDLSPHELYLGALIAPLVLLALVNGVMYVRRRS